MKKVDENDAPEGYKAVGSINCTGCHCKYGTAECRSGKCLPAQRDDGCSVIFVKKDEEKLESDTNVAPAIKTEPKQAELKYFCEVPKPVKCLRSRLDECVFSGECQFKTKYVRE